MDMRIMGMASLQALNEVTEEQRQGLQDLLMSMVEIMDQHDGTLRRAEASGAYTSAGLKIQAAQLAAQTMDRLERLYNVALTGYRGNLEQVQRQLSPSPSKTPDPVRAAEIRAYIRSLDPIHAYTAYTEGSEELQLAVEDSPYPLVQALDGNRTLDQLIEDMKQARAIRRSPEKALLMRQLQSLLDGLDSFMDAARAKLGTLGDPTAKAVNG